MIWTGKNGNGILMLAFFFMLGACKIYSFTGASLPPEIKTISISNFINSGSGGPPNMAQDFTEQLKLYYLQNTSLDLVQNNGDLLIDGEITRYSTAPVAPQGNELAALTRLTISIKINFINTVDEKQNFTQSFSGYEDFPQEQNLSDVEAGLIESIFDRIKLDIFNKTVANW